MILKESKIISTIFCGFTLIICKEELKIHEKTFSINFQFAYNNIIPCATKDIPVINYQPASTDIQNTPKN